MTTRHARIDTDLGELTLVADGRTLTGLYFPEHRPRPDSSHFGSLAEARDDAVLGPAIRELGEYLNGSRREFDVPVTTTGDEFSERVWKLLRDIPFGTTTSYGDLADQLGDRRLAQRVGQAVGRNPISIVIPCHRVLGADGSLTGYAGGLVRKRRLLDLELPLAVAAARLF